MELQEAILCKNYQCVKCGAVVLALLNLVGSTAGIIYMPYTFADVYSQLYQFYKAEGALDQFPEEIKGYAAILVMALLPLIGNLLATVLLLHSLKTESSRRLSVWNWWLLASFILFAALFTVLTVFLGFKLVALIVCLSFMIINLYLGFLVIIIRREIQQHNVNKSESNY